MKNLIKKTGTRGNEKGLVFFHLNRSVWNLLYDLRFIGKVPVDIRKHTEVWDQESTYKCFRCVWIWSDTQRSGGKQLVYSLN